MSVTSDMRKAWAPACSGPLIRINLHGEGRISIRAAAAPAFRALNDILRKHDYETRRKDTGAYNCRRISGGSNYSLHAYGIAADLNWTTNPYGRTLITDMPPGMIEDIERLHTTTGNRIFRWGGRYTRNKDAMHFEVVCTPEQLNTGIKGGGVTEPLPTIEDTSSNGADMYIAVSGIGFFAQFGNSTIPLPGLTLAGFGKLIDNPKSVGYMHISEAAAPQFIEYAMKQTSNAIS